MPLEFQWPFPPTNKVPKKWAIVNKIVIASCGGLSKFWIEWLNRLTVYNQSTIQRLVDERPPNQPLITVSNHYSCLDDPFLWCALRWRHLMTRNECMRWVSGATDICFTKSLHSKFFAFGRTVPTCRGEGVYQKGIDFLLEKLNNGEWVHVFPEVLIRFALGLRKFDFVVGKVNMTHEFMRLKWGVGRLIAECQYLPLVLPMWHLGMDSVLPSTKPYIPRVGKKVTVLIGDPIDFRDMLARLKETHMSPMETRRQITDRIQAEFKLLKQRAEELHFGPLPVLTPDSNQRLNDENRPPRVSAPKDILHEHENDEIPEVPRRIKLLHR